MYKPKENSEIKIAARSIMKGNFWNIWQLIFIYFLCSFALSYIVTLIFGNFNSVLEQVASGNIPKEINIGHMILSTLPNIILQLILVPISFGILYNVCSIVRGVNVNRIQLLFSKFRSGKAFFKTIGVAALISLKVFLWSLLLVVPGIIKALSLSLAPMLLFDEPDLTIRQTLKKSEDMMRGYKGKLALLLLSLYAWIFLSMLISMLIVPLFSQIKSNALIELIPSFISLVVIVFITPYYLTIFAKFYDEMRRSFYDDDTTNNSVKKESGFENNSTLADKPFSDSPENAQENTNDNVSNKPFSD
ncbi:MAG: DUF975 family protein [Clostridia bacterium]